MESKFTHARSLRVIGQKLEVAKLSRFQLEHDGKDYTITSDLMSRTGEWILRYGTTQDTVATGRRPPLNTALQLPPITFTEADLVRLDGLEAKRRREFLEIQPPTRLSHFLRVLGAHLDKPDSAVLDYKRAGGYTDRLRLSPATIGESLGGRFHRVITALPKK